jgi:hypothetical protein
VCTAQAKEALVVVTYKTPAREARFAFADHLFFNQEIMVFYKLASSKVSARLSMWVWTS